MKRAAADITEECFTWNNRQKTALCPLSNARLKLRREAAGFILRMFQPHDRRSSAVGSMFRLVRLNLSKPAGIAPCFRCKNARLVPTPFP